jgi:lipopolysaccharide biosynthesis glycosyltransferase
MTNIETPVRIYVGTDRSQMVGVKVFEYSVKRHTDLPVEVTPLIGINLPQPNDPRQRQRTGFSFARFAIPKLAGYRGRALYTDADMQVFADIRELWTIPFDGAKVIVQEELPEEHAKGKKAHAPGKRVKQCSVMLLDCEALKWNAEEIVRGLDGQYTYEQLMQQLCILDENEIKYGVPFRWNSLEHYDATTCLIHYTDMPTQPWVSAANPNGWLWTNEVRRMLAENVLTLGELEQERKLGYLRPSFLTELKLTDDSRKLTPEQVRQLVAEDASAGFVAHAELAALHKQRKQHIAAYDKLARPGTFMPRLSSGRSSLLERARALFART